GIIVFLNGNVRLYKKGAEDWRQPRLRDKVCEGDKLQTEENSTVKIHLSNGNIISLQSYTEMTFDTLRYDTASGSYDNTLSVNKGRLSAVVERTAKQLTFQVKTPNAVCGVRGTFMEVLVNPTGIGQSVTQAFFEGGSGYLTSLITGQTQDIGAGQNASVDELGTLSNPMFTSPEQRNEIIENWVSNQNMENYSGAEGGAGVGGSQPQQPPQAPLIHQENFTPAADELQDYLDKIFHLNFEQMQHQQPIIYIGDFYYSMGESGYWDVSGNIKITAFEDYTWTGNTSGSWGGAVPPSWYDSYSSDEIFISYSISNWQNGTWSGSVSGYPMNANVEFQGTIGGTYSIENEDPPWGHFQGSASGTWHEQFP
ncbi:MAG: FecR domain-containing protein, partial [Candidatus Omnitrophica bacterium]|nr:FecR domain-containing protein [Candidatus Omnitrophota bacterium]